MVSSGWILVVRINTHAAAEAVDTLLAMQVLGIQAAAAEARI